MLFLRRPAADSGERLAIGADAADFFHGRDNRVAAPVAAPAMGGNGDAVNRIFFRGGMYGVDGKKTGDKRE